MIKHKEYKVHKEHQIILLGILCVLCVKISPAAAQEPTFTEWKTLTGHSGYVTSVAFSPDGSLLASGSADNSIKLWRTSDGGLVRTLTGHSGGVNSVAFSPDGKLLASGATDGTLMLWLIDDFRLIQTIRFGDYVGSVAFSPDGHFILSGGGSGPPLFVSNYGILKMFNLSDISTRWSKRPHKNYAVRSVAFSPDGRMVTSGSSVKSGGTFSDERNVVLFRSSDGSVIWEKIGRAYESEKDNIRSVAFSPDQKYLAGAGDLKKVYLWWIVDGSLAWTLEHNSEVYSIAFSPDGEFLASGGRGSKIKLWRTTDGSLVRTINGHRNSIFSIDFSRDGNLFATGSADSTIRIWRLKTIDNVANAEEPGAAPPPKLVEEQSVDVDINIPSAKSPNRDAVAVVIGNCNYSAEHRDVPDVEFAARDAAVMKEYLLKALGYQEGNILYYTDAGLATFRDVFGTKEEPRGRLANSVKAGKSDVFVYYSGHGAPDVSEKKGYFVPVDCDPNAVSRNGYPLELLYENLGKMGARSVTVVVDACFSGGTSEGKMLIAQASPGAIRIIDPTANWGEGALFTAAAGDQIASWFAEKKHGLFTYAFLKGLQGAADADGDGTITAGELHEFINNGSGDFEGVTYLARRLFNGREQTPGFSGDARRIIR